ncbi:MAG: P-loop NTPase fold protein [bacterium]
MDSARGFASDEPLTNRADDVLNRAAFADRVAAVLRDQPAGASLVVGIHGPWGDGKTTTLNFLRASLRADQAIVVRDFNPWRLTDEEAMFRGFFAMVADAIGASLATRSERAMGRAAKLAKALRWFTRSAAPISPAVEMVDNLLAKLGEAAASGDSAELERLRGRVVALLSSADKRIVVLVDDIDRLDKSETHAVFRIIKSCADFPNVSYVLAFDDAAVASALSERYGEGREGAGRAFLEKIVQVPLTLPLATAEDLRTLCMDEIDRAIARAGLELTQEQVGEFVSGFERGVSVRVTTPRAAKRYGNALKFALPALPGETHVVDVLLVEALRVFYPEVHDVVRENHVHFSGVERDRRGRSDLGPRAEQLLKPVLETMPREDAQAVTALLVDLFPRLSVIFRGINYGADSLSRWERERRISSPEYCARYFTYAVPRSDVPDSHIDLLLELAGGGESSSVEERLAIDLTGARARRTVAKLRAYEMALEPAAAETLAVAVGKLGASLPNMPTPFGFGEPISQAAILISHLVGRVPKGPARVAVAKRVVELAEPLWFGAECVRWLHVTDKPEKEDSNALTAEETAEVRRVLVERIRARAAKGEALFDPDVREERALLFEWWRQDGRAPVQAHLERVFREDPRQVERFLRSMAPLSWSEGNLIPSVGDLGSEQLENIELVIDLDTMAQWVRRCCAGDFENPHPFFDDTKSSEQRLAEGYMLAYNARKREEPIPGDNPRSP